MKIRPHFKYNPSHQWFSVYLKVFPVQIAVGMVILKCDLWLYILNTRLDRPWWRPRTHQWPRHPDATPTPPC